jgi:ATP:ADP antiporter, AAA family
MWIPDGRFSIPGAATRYPSPPAGFPSGPPRLPMHAFITSRWLSWLAIDRTERIVLGWSFLYFFSLLCGYYVLRPVRDAMGASSDVLAVFPVAMVDWFAARGVQVGDYTLQILFTGTFIGMLLAQPFYGALVSRFPRRMFLPFVYGFFILCLLGFHVAFHTQLPGRGGLFFIWLAVFNLFAVSVFWSFMADIHVDRQARRLYGYIAAGGTLGGLVGPELTARLVGTLGVANLLLVSALFIGLALLCILALIPAARRAETRQGHRHNEDAIGGTALAGLRLIVASPVLRWLALLMFFGVGVGTLLYYEQAANVRRAMAADAEAATLFYSQIDRAINWLVLLVQVFLTRYLLTRFGLAPLLLLPAGAVVIGFSILSASPLPLLITAVQVMTRASEFALAKPARETIFTRVDRESRYKAKAAIDTVVYRGGDLTFGWLHKPLALFGSQMVFAFGVLVAGGFMVSAWQVIRAQRRLPQVAPETAADMLAMLRADRATGSAQQVAAAKHE